MSVGADKLRQYSERNRRSAEIMREMAEKRGNVCPCGTILDDDRNVCFTCWQAAPEWIKGGLRSNNLKIRALARESLRLDAAKRAANHPDVKS